MNIRVRNSFSEALGYNLLALLFFILLTSAVSFLLHLSVSAAILPVSLILASIFTYLFIAKGKCFLYSLLTVILILIFSCLVSGLIYDTTYDSYSYHYNAVVMMSKGWNPFYETPWNDSMWNRHYAKGLEIMQSAVLALTGNLQSSKSINLMFILSAASIAWFTIGKVFPAVSCRWKIAIVIMMVANPVVLSQMTTAYNDYMLWIETVLLCCSFLLIWKDGRDITYYSLLLMVFVIGINSKFTHFYYLGMQCIFFAVWCCLAKRFYIVGRGVVTLLLAVLIGGLLIGFNPYIINTVEYGNPCYPLVGGDVDIMTRNTPEMYMHSNRVTNFFMSLLSTDDVPWAYLNGNTDLSDCLKCYSVDARVNGFGLFMLPLILLGIVLMFCNRASWKWWIVYIFCLALGFSFEQSWWARYVPFIWALVIIPVLNFTAEDNGSRKLLKNIMAVTMFALVVINAVIATGGSLITRCRYTCYINYIVDAQKKSGKPVKVAGMNYTMRQIFDERGVDYVEYEDAHLLKDSSNLFVLYYLYYPIFAELPEEDYPSLYEPPESKWDKLMNLPARKYDPTHHDEKP